MRIIILEDHNYCSKWVANYIANNIQTNSKVGSFKLGLPTGGTPKDVYKHLVTLYQNKVIDFSHVETFNMDEYIGLDKNNENSYFSYMNENFFKHVNLKQYNMPEGMNTTEYDKKLTGIDLFFGGLGENGHLAFNEPGTSFTSRTSVARLTEETRQANSRFFGGLSEVPKAAITVGLANLLEAKQLLIMATGKNKSRAVKAVVEGAISTHCPGTILQQHDNGILVIDHASASDLCYSTVSYWKQMTMDTDIFGKLYVNSLQSLIKPNHKIVIFSPHPDDDVIGMGATMYLLPNYDNVTVNYMTNGNRHEKNNNSRLVEANHALLSLNHRNYNCLNLPFYNLEKFENSSNYSQNDIEKVKLSLENNPEHIFICGDKDPNGTHEICSHIIMDAFSSKQVDSPEYKPYLWFYRGAWDWKYNPNIIVKFSADVMEKKLLAIRLHRSQFPLKVPGSDPRPLDTRAFELNKNNHLYFDQFAERFLVTKIN